VLLRMHSEDSQTGSAKRFAVRRGHQVSCVLVDDIEKILACDWLGWTRSVLEITKFTIVWRSAVDVHASSICTAFSVSPSPRSDELEAGRGLPQGATPHGALPLECRDTRRD
jgi:hypothetical protein